MPHANGKKDGVTGGFHHFCFLVLFSNRLSTGSRLFLVRHHK